MKKILLSLACITMIIGFSVNMSAQTTGTLTFTFTPVSHVGYDGTKNVLAVWIQTGTDAFVKTKIRYVGAAFVSSTTDHLPIWAANSGGTGGNTSYGCNTTDAVTGATLTSFTTKTTTWDGKNVNGTSNGTVVADGTYKVTIEECWNHGTSGTTTRSFTFTKGPNSDIQTPANDGNFTNISLQWIPTATGIERISVNPEINVYPNPTNGKFNVDFDKAGRIKVINTLGSVVYEEKIDGYSAGTKSIDLTNFANGIYFISVSNDQGTSNYRIILNN